MGAAWYFVGAFLGPGSCAPLVRWHGVSLQPLRQRDSAAREKVAFFVQGTARLVLQGDARAERVARGPRRGNRTAAPMSPPRAPPGTARGAVATGCGSRLGHPGALRMALASCLYTLLLAVDSGEECYCDRRGHPRIRPVVHPSSPMPRLRRLPFPPR